MATELRHEEAIPDISLPHRKVCQFVFCGALLWGIAVFLWLQRGIDKAYQLGHSAFRKIPAFVETAKALSTYGMALCVLIFLVCLALSFRIESMRDLQKIYLPILLSFSIAGLAGDLSKEIFARPRPFLEYADEIVPITKPPSYSIPSGHTVKSFALVLPFLAFAPGRRRWQKVLKAILLLVAAGVAYSRIVLGVHYLSDILCGIGTAFLFLPLAGAVTNTIYTKNRMTSAAISRLSAICGLILFCLIYYLIHYS